MTEGKKIGLQIKGMRKQCGFTQEKVANDLFISQSYLRKIETGQLATPKIVDAICEILGISVQDDCTKRKDR